MLGQTAWVRGVGAVAAQPLLGQRAAWGRRQGSLGEWLRWTRVGVGLQVGCGTGFRVRDTPVQATPMQVSGLRLVATGHGLAERPIGAKGVAPMAWDPQLRARAAREGPLLPTLPAQPTCEPPTPVTRAAFRGPPFWVQPRANASLARRVGIPASHDSASTAHTAQAWVAPMIT